MKAGRISQIALAVNEMATRAKSLGKPDAAKVIVEDCYKLIRNN